MRTSSAPWWPARPGIDLVLLVIAADEGIMPQTEEHLAILEQLGVAAGIPVITKADLVDASGSSS